MLYRIKEFSASEYIGGDINEWFGANPDIEVIDIKYQLAVDVRGSMIVLALILYKGGKK